MRRWRRVAVVAGVIGALGQGYPVAVSAAPVSAQRATAQRASATQVTLRVPASVAGPYRAADASVSVSPGAGQCPLSWELQEYLNGRWVSLFNPADSTEFGCTYPEVGYAWRATPGTMTLRAYVPAQGELPAAGYSQTVTVQVGTARPPHWLVALNRLRALNDAPAVPMDTALDNGAFHHARYMLHAGELTHVEDPHNKWYTKDGARAGEAGDEAFGPDPIRQWAETEYHQNIEIDPSAVVAGYGTDQGYDSFTVVWNTAYQKKGPYFAFPAAGKTTWLTEYLGGEIPDPLVHCPAAWRRRLDAGHPLGLPLEFSLESTYHLTGRQPTRVTASLTTGGKASRLCTFFQKYAGVTYMLPLLPLAHGRGYDVAVRYDGKLAGRWRFRVSR